MVSSSSLQTNLAGKEISISITTPNRIFFNNEKTEFYRNAFIPDNEKYTDFIMVGRGDIGRPKTCGKFYGSFICDCHQSRKGKKNFCMMMQCPICFHKATHRTSERTRLRFWKIYKILKIKYKHYSFNTYWDEKHYCELLKTDKEKAKEYYNSNKIWDIKNLEDYYKAKKKLQKILASYGASGLLIFHPFRPHKYATNTLRRSGHFHFIGFGYFPEKNNVPRGDFFFKKHGFNFTDISYKNYNTWIEKDDKKFRKSNKPYIKTKLELYLTIRYLLTHSAYFGKKRKSYGWIGYLHSCNWSFKQKEIKEIISCEFCHSYLYLITDTPIDTTWDEEKLIHFYKLPLQRNTDKFLIKKVYSLKATPRFKHDSSTKIQRNDINPYFDKTKFK